MKTLFLFNDTETTGITKKESKRFSVHQKEQALTYALVLCEKDNTILEEEVKIKLKDNVLPNPAALLINNINPFDASFLSNAKTEYEGAHYFANKILEYKKQGFRVVFIAYNAEYDVNIVSDMFIRSGLNFNAIIDCVFDPLLMTRQLVKRGDIKTRLIESYGKSYNSASLEDVYNGLGYSSEAITAHNALEDTKMLKSVVYKAYLLYTGKSFDEADADASTFVAGAEKTIGYIEEMELKIKTIKVLKSNSTGRFLALDLDMIKESPDKVKSCIVEMHLNNVLDEYDLKIKESNEVESFYNQNRLAIDETVSKNALEDVVFGTHEQLYFGAVEKLAEKMMNDSSIELDEKEKEILDWAEEYAYARFNQGWSVKLKGANHENAPKSYEITPDISIELDPEGSFVLKQNGEVVTTAEKKSDILEQLDKKLGVAAGTPEYKKASSILVPVKSFKSVKYPKELIKEFNEKKNLVFNGANKLHKETLKGLKEYYQRVNMEAFKELTIPDFKLNLNIFMKK